MNHKYLSVFSIIALAVFISGISTSIMANDWDSTGKGGSGGQLSAEQVEAAWAGLETYKSGEDQNAQLAIEWVVINSLNDPQQRTAVAKRLADLLAKPELAIDIRCFICSKLYVIGTESEVPAVAKLLADPATADIARLFLERVDCPAATDALRKALADLTASDDPKCKRALIGVMNSLSLKQDSQSVPAIIKLTSDADKEVALAAWRALSNIGNQEVANFLIEVLKSTDKANVPAEVAAVRTAIILKDTAPKSESVAESVATIYTLLAQPYRGQAARQAGYGYLLAKADDAKKSELIQQWTKSEDSALTKLVLASMTDLSDEAIRNELATEGISSRLMIVLTEELAARQGEKMLPEMIEAAKSADPAKSAMGLRFIGASTDPKVVPVLINALSSDNETNRKLATDALARKSKEEVGKALLEVLNTKPAIREQVVAILSNLKYYEAIDPLCKIARDTNPEVYEGAVEGLRAICDPDEIDLRRMLDLYIAVPAGKHRDFVERAIAFIAEKNTNKPERATILLSLIDAKADNSSQFQAVVLPLLGRLGTDAVYKRIDPALKSTNPILSAAAVRALCNWPNADHAPALWDLAVNAKSKAFRSQGLRAYIRVVTLPNDRAEDQTLEMLQNAFKAAETDRDRQLAVSRAAVVRTIDCVEWLKTFLDDKQLSETAAETIVELAHHRFLRQPNKEFFEPILTKIESTSKKATTREKAEKARMGM